jgi:hypothetical protein
VTPTLVGRIQTRWFLLAVVGVPWTIVVAPFLLPFAGDAGLGDVYAVAFAALVTVGVLGTGWELLYHWLMQYRWEKDWPALFGLVTAVPEFFFVVAVLAASGFSITFAVVLHFVTLWLWIWLVANGPLRVVFPRWRYRGGRIG